MRTFPITGIVIKRKDFNEADKFITFFSKERGKLVVKAKGIRKISSKRAPHLELFNIVRGNLHQSSGGYLFLSEADTIETFPHLKSRLNLIGFAYHVCELIEGLCPENEPHEQIFKGLHRILEDLSITDHAGKLIHAFEIFLLSELGYYANQDLQGAKASLFIESILERKLKSRQILPHLL